MINEKLDELHDAMLKATHEYFAEKNRDDVSDMQIVSLSTKEELAKGITTYVAREIKL